MAENSEFIVDTLRTRVLRGLQTGTLAVGDRLPSARTLALEFGVDFRAILNAYRALSNESLVALRPRGGVYVAEQRPGHAGLPPLPADWITDVLAQGLARSIRPAEFHEWFRRCTETLRLRAAVIGSTDDDIQGLCRELADDFGFDAEGLTAEYVRAQTRVHLAIRRADLLVTTDAHAKLVRRLGADLAKPVAVLDVQSDMLRGEWALLLRQPLYAVVATEDFGRMLQDMLAAVPGVENLRVLVFGKDDLATIPPDALTYVTQRVRASLGATTIPGRSLPPARTIRPESARELLAFIVRSNIAAVSARSP